MTNASTASPIAAITGVAGYLPEFRLTNALLEEMVDTNDEWIRTRTGIEERRILKGEGLGTSDMAKEAVNELLRKTNTAPEEVDLLICATVTPDMQFPSTANLITDKTGLSKAWGFDISAACSGFLFALDTGAQFINAGRCKKVIVVGADKMSSIVDYEDRATCIIFGDGAGAVMLEASTNGHGIHDSELHTDGAGSTYLHMKGGGSQRPASHKTIDAKDHYIYQDGKTVFKFAVSNMAGVVGSLLNTNQLAGEDIDWLVPHQANKRIIDATARTAKIPSEKVMVNIQKYGNTTAGTIPLCLRDWESKLKTGDKIILTAFGGGFTWGATYLTWAYDTPQS